MMRPCHTVTQTVGVVGSMHYRRMQTEYFGHLIRADPGCLERRDLLRQWELVKDGYVHDQGTLVSEALAATSTDMLI